MRWTYNIPEAAKHLGISRNLMYRLAKDGTIPTIRLGKKRLVISTDVLNRLLTEGIAALSKPTST